MKTMTRNIFLLACILPGTALLAVAQTAAPVAQTAPAGLQLLDKLPAPATANVTSVWVDGQPVARNSSYGYEVAYGGREFKDGELKSKEVSKEISIPKSADIYIENASRGIVIKTWDQQKVKVTTTIYYDGETKLTDDEWLEKVNLSLKTLGSSVKIKSGSIGGNNAFYSYSSPSPAIAGTISSSGSFSNGGVAVFNGSGQNIGTKNNLKRIVTITVPAGSKLDIESKYSDVTLPAGIGDVNVDITNGNLEADNLGKLVLRSKYSNANIGDIKTAELEFSNGRFSAKNIDDLDIESKNSTIEMAAAKKMVMRSTTDEYELEEAGEVRGRKTYGNLRITKLDGSLEMDGNNANVKIRKVGPALSFIKIDGKYADIRIPLRDTKNYSIDFAGTYSSVYGNFEKKPVVVEKEKETKGTLNTVTIDSRTAPPAARAYTSTAGTLWLGETNGPSKFTATVGDGKGLKVDIKCPNCTVDFK